MKNKVRIYVYRNFTTNAKVYYYSGETRDQSPFHLYIYIYIYIYTYTHTSADPGGGEGDKGGFPPPFPHELLNINNFNKANN